MVYGNLVPFDPLRSDKGAGVISLRTIFFVCDGFLTAKSLILLHDIGDKEPSQIRPVSWVVGFCPTTNFLNSSYNITTVAMTHFFLLIHILC